MLYICAKFHEIISKGYQSYRVDTISTGKITKEIILPKMQVEQILLISARRLSCFILLLSFVKLSQTISKLKSGHDFNTEN